MKDDHILLGSADHGQKYGLPAPINASAQITAFLKSDRIFSVCVGQYSGDIRLTFSSGKELQMLPFSSGYEAWESLSPDGFSVIAQGGQQLSGFKR